MEPLLETLPDQLQVLIMRWQYQWLALLEPACVTEADGKYIRKRPSLISLNILQWLFSPSKPSHILFVICQVAVLIHHNLSLPFSVIKKQWQKWQTDANKILIITALWLVVVWTSFYFFNQTSPWTSQPWSFRQGWSWLYYDITVQTGRSDKVDFAQ